MIPTPPNDEHLERLVHRTLRELPLRSAPRSLESRVLAEIARRAALPWWRKSFAHWPLAAQAGFVVLSIGLAKLALSIGLWVMQGFDSAQFTTALAQQFAWVESVRAVARAIGSFCEIMTRNIPPLWLYGGLAFVAVMYATLVGLGATAYRVFFNHR